MYPQLTLPLAIGFALAAGLVVFLMIFRPVLRRLALRQVIRRPTESILVVLGSVLGTALIVASLTVGDSLNRTVRQTAYEVLGPVDEYVRSPSATVGDDAARRLAPLRADQRIDGLLTARVEPSAAVLDAGGRQVAEPRTLVWEMDFAQAARFGAPDASGLAVRDPGPGRAVINRNLAESLGARVGDRVSFFVYGRPLVAQVAAIVPAEGLGGVGLGASLNRDAFLSPGALTAAARAANRDATTITFVSNPGGVEGGARLTRAVSDQLRSALGPLAASGASIQTPKREVLDNADRAGNQLGSLFLFVASFSIIAGVLLIVNIFVMLTDERRGQLGILRAIGMRRRRVSAALAMEGAVYSAAAVVLGGLLGVGLARVVVILAVKVLNGFNTGDNKLSVVFAVTPTSVANGMMAGFLIAFAAVVLTSVRIARANVIAAIRDLEPSPRLRTRRRLTVVSAVVTAVLAAASVPVLVSGRGMGVYLLPTLTVVAAIPLLRRFWPARPVYTVVGLAILGWGLLAHLVRPHMFDDAKSGTFVVQGSMLTFAAVLLISQHQDLLLWPLRPLLRRSSATGLAARLAVAYPTAKRFRTGAQLAMYCIVVLVIVLLIQISAIIDAGVNRSITEATAGWTLRAEYQPTAPVRDPQLDLVTGAFGGKVTDVVTLVTAPAEGDDPLRRSARPLPVMAIGVSEQLSQAAPEVQKRLPQLADDAAMWRLVLDNSSYVVVDAFYGSPGGPQGETVRPGSTITLTDPQTGKRTARTIAGVLSSGLAFYGLGSGEFRYPVLMSQPATREAFGTAAQPSGALLRTAPGVDVRQVSAALQRDFLANGLVVTDLSQAVRDNFASNRQFFLLMQGYLALGLLVGITGLGVIMVRAVRERRRTIAVLRALGFQARIVRLSFFAESAFIAAEGVIVGTVLGVLTTWLLYQNSPAFGSLDVAFPIAWTQIAITVGAALVASLLATVGPARRAAGINPAVALRVAG